MVSLFSYSRWVFGISAGMFNIVKGKIYCHLCLSLIKLLLILFTHIGDPNGHPLIEEVEDHDDDKVDAGGGDRRGQLRSDEFAHQLDLPHGVFDDTCEGSIHSQPVCYDSNDTGHYQRNLWEHACKTR